MRAFAAAAVPLASVLAILLTVAPLAAQAKPGTRTRERRTRHTATTARRDTVEDARNAARARFKIWADGAILLAARIEGKQDSTAEHLHTDANALGGNLDDAESALAELRRGATGAEKARLDSVRTQLKQARSEYDQLRKAEPDVDAVATHAASLHAHLTAAERILGMRATPRAPRRTTPARPTRLPRVRPRR